MPKLFTMYGYQISIWSNEYGEPIHVHISKRRPSANSTKLWLCSDGRFIMANSKDKRIPENILRNIIRELHPLAGSIRDAWVSYHGYEKYYK